MTGTRYNPIIKQGTIIRPVVSGDNFRIDEASYFQFGTDQNKIISDIFGTGNFEAIFDENVGNGAFVIRNSANTIHYTFGNGGGDFDTRVEMRAGIGFIEQALDATTVGDTIALYSKDVSGITQLFSRDSSGAITQLTGTAATENLWDRSGSNLRPHTAGDSVTLGDTAHPRAGDTGLLKILGGDNTGYQPIVTISAADGSFAGYSANMILDGDGAGGGDAAYYLKNQNVTNANWSTSGGPGGAVSYQVFNDRDGTGALNADFLTIDQVGAIDSGDFNFNTGTVVNGVSGDINLTTGTVSGAGTRGDINLTARNLNFAPSGTTTLTLAVSQAFIVDRTPTLSITPVTDANKVVEYISDGNATNFWFNAPNAGQGGSNTTFGFAENGVITSALTYNISIGYLAMTNDGANGTPTTGVIVLNNGEVCINTNTNADFPNSQLFVTRSDSGISSGVEIGIVGEASGDLSRGVFGASTVTGTGDVYGLFGIGHTSASGNTGSAVGVYASSTTTHAGGDNVAVFAIASGGANSFSFDGFLGILRNTDQGIFGSGLPNASAKLQIDSTTQGFLPPRMTTAQRDAIASPATGLMLFNTTVNEWHGYNGTAWVTIG